MGQETQQIDSLLKKISIITINYNNAAGLEKTVKSVITQNSSDFEFIIVDGGSNDGSLDLIKKYASKITQYVSEKDKGIYHAQNKGILMSSGEYCLFLNSGDLLAGKEVLESVVAELNGADIVYGDIVTIDVKGTRTHLKSPAKIGVSEMMISTLWHPSAFIKRQLFDTFGLYNEDFKVTGDYEFFIRTILKNNVAVKHVPLAIAVFDLTGVSNTAEFAALQTKERKKSWALNFGEPVIEAFENKTRLLRSREYKLGKLFMKFTKPFLRKK